MCSIRTSITKGRSSNFPLNAKSLSPSNLSRGTETRNIAFVIVFLLTQRRFGADFSFNKIGFAIVLVSKTILNQNPRSKICCRTLLCPFPQLLNSNPTLLVYLLINEILRALIYFRRKFDSNHKIRCLMEYLSLLQHIDKLGEVANEPQKHFARFYSRYVAV